MIRMIARRHFLTLLALAGAAFSLAAPLPAMAQGTAKPEELAKAGPLGDVVLGNPDAKVTVIEYASLTCSHCGRFHNETFPQLKAKYIDTGKIRFISREFVFDRDVLALAGFMLARCNGNDRYYAMLDLLFEQQRNWAFVEKPLDALYRIVRQAGFTQESAEACLKRQDLYEAINQVRNHAAQRLGVNSTPTFFINGQMRSGALTIAEFDEILKPLVGE
jgi:protein-disulfide isomerase